MYGGIKNHITGEVKHLPSDRTLCKINGQWTNRIEMDFSEEVVSLHAIMYVVSLRFLTFKYIKRFLTFLYILDHVFAAAFHF